ncbi:hypothetical protein ACKWTF_009266 [Chironomus riparius]
MNTSKQISRIQQDSPDTPLRRRSALNASTPFLNESHRNESVLNDDEAERRKSRRVDPSDSGTNLSEAADSLNNCLKLYAENKICKDNAWTLNIIDSFSKLIKKHHHSLSNFQVAGSTLEASAKVYSLRVDSVYTDVLRMSADLSRQTAKALTKKNRLNLEEESDRDDNNEDKENQDANNQDGENPTQKPKQKTTKKRKHVSTVTKNPETLNGRLDTHPLVDPFFAKLNSMVGDINSSQRLMQNIIPTKDSNLKLRQNVKIWDSQEEVDVTLDDDFRYTDENSDIYQINSISGSVANAVLRTELKHYRICDIPMENAEEANVSMHIDNNDLNMSVGRNASHIGLQFDINAEIEPIQTEKSFVIDFGDMNDNDFEDIGEEEMVALERCKGLKRQPIMIEDMQPDSVLHLEYSYRPLDMIDQFWAGPSHWKFRQSRRTHATSIGGRSTLNRDSAASNQVFTTAQKPKISRKKKIIKKSEIGIEDLLKIEDDDLISPITKKTKGNQLTTHVMVKKWDSKKLKLPTDFRVPNETFDSFAHAISIHIATNPDATFTCNDDESPYDYDNENDRNYCSRLEVQSDTETETNTDIGQLDNNMEFDNVEMPPPLVPDEIPDFYVGAPERIEKINIAFAKRAKVVDMKQLKLCSWNLISRKNVADPLHHPHFADILKDLPKMLNKTMAENMSMPLAFYAILHLCNDKGLLLEQNNNDLKDFEIIQVD